MIAVFLCSPATLGAAAGEQRQEQIEVDRVRQKQAFLASIGRNVGDADGVGVGDLGEGRAPHGGAIREYAELFGLRRDGAVEAHHEVFLPVADEAADPEDFAAMELEIDVDRARGAKALRLEDELARRMRGVGRKQIPGIAADHQADEASRIEPGERTIGGDRSVLQNGDIVAEVEDLIEPVRDIEDGDARSRSRRTSLISIATSGAASDDVGSSRMSTRGLTRAPWRSRRSAGGQGAVARPACPAIR